MEGLLQRGGQMSGVAWDAEAFAGLYRRHERAMVAFLLRRTRNPELAADLAAEVFAAALLSWRSGERPELNERGWLYAIARHKLIDSYRRGRVEDEARLRLGMHPIVLSDESVARIEALLSETPALDLVEQLPTDQREAVTARVVEDREYAEIAKELSLSEQVVRKRVSRGLARLRAVMGGER
jgi:RNA polymerase sigma factor (sigma-70 family)